MKVKVGVIGCGRISRKSHLKALLELKDKYETIFLADINDESLQESAKMFLENGLNKPKLFRDYKNVDVKDVDLIVVSTSTDSHYEIAKWVLENKKHLIIEKPAALSTAKISELIALSEENNLKVGVGLQVRYCDHVKKVREKIENGVYGKLMYSKVTIRWNRDENYYKVAPWRGKWKSDGGMLLNQGLHAIDLLVWFLGKPKYVYAKLNNFTHKNIEIEDFASAIIEFEDDKYAILEASISVYPQNIEESIALFFEKATIIIGGRALNKIVLWESWLNEDVDKEKIYTFPHTPLYENMYEAIINNKELLVDLKNTYDSHKLVFGIYKSHLKGERIDIPEKFDIEEMLNNKF